MTSSSMLPSGIVVDASVVVRALLPAEQEPDILEYFSDWHKSRSSLYAPDILLPEVTSVLRRGIYNHWITGTEARTAIEDVFRLGIEIVQSDHNLCISALEWAARLEQSKAYDGFYLAVAERTISQVWTADQKLVHRALQLNIPWVHWIGEN